jgi:ribosomal protein S18 acetylase RimI-like enzyme
MPEIEIRPATAKDIPPLTSLEHNYTSEYVWQMELQREENQTNVIFREVRLPRSVQVAYPRDIQSLSKTWKERSGLLVSVFEDEVVGYINLMQNMAPKTTWATDLVVMRRSRRQGIASALILAAQEWAIEHGSWRLVLEMQPKNHAAIRLAQKLGFDFCGYNDRYYINQDIALFFAKWLK